MNTDTPTPETNALWEDEVNRLKRACDKWSEDELLHPLIHCQTCGELRCMIDDYHTSGDRGATCWSIEFICAACGDKYVGDPIIRNGCQLCSDCQNSPLFTVRDIAKYIAGWTMGSFDEVRKLGQHVAHNALHQLRDDQDGIEAFRNRNNSQNV